MSYSYNVGLLIILGRFSEYIEFYLCDKETIYEDITSGKMGCVPNISLTEEKSRIWYILWRTWKKISRKTSFPKVEEECTFSGFFMFQPSFWN